MRARLWSALGLSLALAAPAVAAPGGQDAAGASPQPARTAALLAYQRDLVSVLAPRADAMPLLGAALLARPLPKQPKYNDFHSLIGRAAQADDSTPAVQWVRLVDCSARAGDCPNPDALAALTAQAGDNAAVWLMKLARDTADDKADAVREDLRQAAAAKLYDDYTGSSLAALAGVVDALPPPPATQGTGGPVGVQALIVQGNARLQPRPALPVVAKLCENAGDDDAIKADCLKLGKLLEWGSSPLARSLGLHLREVLGDATAQADARQQRRDLIWQVQNYSQLALRAQDDPGLAQQLLAAAKQGGTEMSQLTAVLRASGVSTTAPGSWQPPAPDAPAPAHSP